LSEQNSQGGAAKAKGGQMLPPTPLERNPAYDTLQLFKLSQLINSAMGY